MANIVNYAFGQLLHPDSILTFLWKTEDFVEKTGRRRPQGMFSCECGTFCQKTLTAVKTGKVKSCGCYVKTAVSKANTKHGNNGHELYDVWYRMIERCCNKESKDYKDYGGRGIKVCSQWKGAEQGFPQFVKDIGERPSGYTLERIENDGHYEPSNVRWASRYEQNLNRRMTKTNSSGKTGVSWNKKEGKWDAYISNKGIRHLLIQTNDFELAAFCREEAEIHFHGKYTGH